MIADEPVQVAQNGLLLKGVEPYICTEPRCAVEFLRLLEAGELEIGRQQRIVSILLDLHSAVRYKGSRMMAVAPQLGDTIRAIHTNVEQVMRGIDDDLEIDHDHLSNALGFGGNAGAICYGLSVARSAALCAFIRAFCEKAMNFESLNDLCGDWFLSVTAPKDAEYADEFAGTYGFAANATITKRQAQHWHVRFDNFPPMANWYGLEGAAYTAAAPILAYVLQSDVRAIGNLSD